MSKIERKLTLGLVFLGIGAGLILLALVLYRAAPDNVPGIIAALAGAIGALAAGVLAVMQGFKAEYQAKAPPQA